MDAGNHSTRAGKLSFQYALHSFVLLAVAFTLVHVRGGYTIDWVRCLTITPAITLSYHYSTKLKTVTGRTIVFSWADAIFIFAFFTTNPFTTFIALVASTLIDDVLARSKILSTTANLGAVFICWIVPYYLCHLPITRIDMTHVALIAISFIVSTLGIVTYLSIVFDRAAALPSFVISSFVPGVPGVIFGSLAAYFEHFSIIGTIFVSIMYAGIIFATFHYSRFQAEREKYKIFEQFFDFSDSNIDPEEVTRQIIELTNTLTRRDDSICVMRAPEKSEIGAKISSPHYPDQWIILSKQRHAGSILGSDQKILNEIAKVGSRIIDQVSMRNQLENAARIDPLTGLANRRMFEEVLARDLAAIERHEETGPLSLLFIDIDKFKPVNDVYGHDVGDRLLQVISRRLMKTVRDEDFVSRLGGDEFVVICRGIEESQAFSLSERIVEILSQPYILRRSDSTITLEIGASIGVASAPRNGLAMHELIVASDRAMYAAKKSDGTSAVCAA
jgi:diguanylate cyclase (GGDEF)-like protein